MKVIFHYPGPLYNEGVSGSRIRPFQMRQAFQQIGCEVEAVVGYAEERKQSVRRIDKVITQGRRFDFVYSEAASIPTLFTEPSHWPNHPFLDFGFFRRMKAQGVPIGLFYRDVYWRFPAYRQLAWYKRIITIPFYWYDWKQYLHCVDYLFLPSLDMEEALPSAWPRERVAALPGGCTVSKNSERITPTVLSNRLALLYVGNILPPYYNLKPLLEATAPLKNLDLTICCRREDWSQSASFYQDFDFENIQIVSVYGKALELLYSKTDLFCLVLAPNPYRDFAMPLKLFEALGYAVPTVTFSGTAAARFVEDEKIGWVVSSVEELQTLFRYLAGNSRLLLPMREHLKVVREKHTWKTRAETVLRTLLPQEPST